MRLLMLEKQVSSLAAQICDDRWFIVHADTADEAMSMLRHETYDLILVDIIALGQEGFSFIRRLRTARNDTPVVALTSSQAQDRISALGFGADDAITQPCDAGEMRARVTAVVRRNKGHSQSLLQVGDLSLSLETREVSFNNTPIHLSGKESAVLELLMLRKGLVITKEMLLNHLYGGMDEPEMKIIDVFVCKLRKRLERAGLMNVIETVWGRGYTLRNAATLSPLSLASTAGGPPTQLVV